MNEIPKLNQLLNAGTATTAEIEAANKQLESTSGRTGPLAEHREVLKGQLSDLQEAATQFGIQPEQYAELINRKLHRE